MLLSRLKYFRWLIISVWFSFVAGCVNPGYQELSTSSFPDHADVIQDTGPFKGPLTLSAAIERALVNHVDVAVLRSAVDIAVQRKKAAGDLEDPQIRMSYSDGKRDRDSRGWDAYDGLPYEIITNTVSTSRGFSTGIRFFVPHPWIRAARISAESANVNAARMDLKAAQWTVSVEVCRLFTEISHLENDIEILDQIVAIYEENIKLFKSREQARQVSIPEVMSVSQKYLQALSSRDRVLRKLAESRMALASLTALPADNLKLAEQGDAIGALDLKTLTVDQLEQKALVSRADLSALYWRRLAAQEACREARAARIPWFNFLQFSYANTEQNEDGTDTTWLMPPGSDTGYERSDSDVWKVDMAITIPIFSWANNTPELRQAEYRQIDLTLAQTVRKIYQSFQETLGVMRSLGERQSKFDAEAGPVISDMKKVLESLDKEIGMSPDQMIKVREQILDLQRLKLEQDYEFRLGVLSLEESLGVWLVPVEMR